MNKKAIWTIVLAIIVLLGIVWLLGLGREGAEVEAAEISIEDQEPGDTITVDEVTLAEPGFIVIRTPEGTVVGESSLRQAGTFRNVIITLDETAEEGEEFEAVVIVDTDNDGQFDEDADMEAETSLGGTVLEGFMILSEEDETATTTDDEAGTTTDDMDTGAETSQPAPEETPADPNPAPQGGGSLY